MTFAETWIRQVLGATGATLLVPVAVLIAAGVLAAGSGLGGISSLGQIGAGPTLPEPGIDSASSLGDADIVGADLASPELAAGDGTAAATIGDIPAGTGGAPLPSPLTQTGPGGGGGGGGFSAPDGPGEGIAPPGGGVPPGDGGPGPGSPVDEVVGPGGLADEVTQPIAPVTDRVIDLISPDP